MEITLQTVLSTNTGLDPQQSFRQKLQFWFIRIFLLECNFGFMIFMLGNDDDFSKLSPTVQGVIMSAGLQGDNILARLHGY